MQVAAVGALWRAISCAKHACGKRDSADGLRDLALCLDLSRMINHYETILAALQIARSLWIRAAVLRCRRTLAGAYDTSTPLIRDQKHQGSAGRLLGRPARRRRGWYLRNDRKYGELRGGRRMANGRALDWEKGSAWTMARGLARQNRPVGPAGDAGPMTPGGTKTVLRPYVSTLRQRRAQALKLRE